MTEAQPIELHGARTGNCIRVAIAFEEAGLAYTPVRVNLMEAEHRGEAYRALNPAAKVPTIVEHSAPGMRLVVSQSNAIMLYAAHKAPGKLLPAPGTDRYVVALERYFYFVTDVIAVSHASFMIRNRGAIEANKLLDERVIAMIEGAERFLHDGDYLAGDSFTLADICAVSIVNSVHRHVDWNAHPKLARWYEIAMARPSVRRGFAAF